MDADALTAWIDERVDAHEFSGVALAVQDGVPIFSYASAAWPTAASRCR